MVKKEEPEVRIIHDFVCGKITSHSRCVVGTLPLRVLKEEETYLGGQLKD